MDLINSFAYLGFEGPVALKGPDQVFCLFEEWPPPSATAEEDADGPGADEVAAAAAPRRRRHRPRRMFLGRRVGRGARELAHVYDLKKRRYISTTSMDAELALATANLALAGPGKLFYDPFVGTGSFPIACAHFGAVAVGSDIDGRALHGRSKTENIRANFDQYALSAGLGDLFTADLTNSPVRMPHPTHRLFDGIVCDPPYGVREGLRVLGCRDPERQPWVIEAGKKTYMCVYS